MNIQIQGILHKIFEATVNSTGFEKRVFWIKENEGRNILALEAHQGMSNEVVRFAPGMEVLCQVELQGREWHYQGEAKVTNTLRCWKIEAVDRQTEAAVNQAARNVERMVK
jgi:hypothetical protein